MAFSLVQTVTDKTTNTGVTQVTDKTMFDVQEVTDKNLDGVQNLWEDKGVSAFRSGMPIGLLLALTYTL